mmetsp:Transcript_8521/g.12341  ORF Transcript_8521/g.12341 Transcript_8521/m.12341 type:complete len:207 (+) Transcript_8521:560-1180(+)
MKYVSDRGVIICVAAGNMGHNEPLTNDISWPAFYLEAISVAAWHKKDGRAVTSFSENRSQKYDFAGYGDNVISLKPGGGFKCLSGTSVACPHVTGLIACLMSKGVIKNEGKHTNTVLREKLKSYTIDIGLEGPGDSKGLGFLTYLTKDEFWDVFYGRKAVKKKEPAKEVTFDFFEEAEDTSEKEKEKPKARVVRRKSLFTHSNTFY